MVKEDRYLKIANVAQLIDVSEETVRKWIKQKRIRYYKWGRSVRIRKSDLMEFAVMVPSRDELGEELMQ